MDAVADSSSSSSKGLMNHDVFLSFRGPDTRRIFAGHLHAALQRKTIRTFIDSADLEKGTEISNLFKAIDMSKLSVVVFSKNYASSTWCLKELAKIMNCMEEKEQIVVPVFYDIEPADVRHQRGSFKEAFEKHKQDGWVTSKDLRIWKSALTTAATLSGWESHKYEDDLKFVEDIATNILGQLKPASKYDVFLSSCKLDHKKFGSHLYAGLKQKGISAFVAAEEKGNPLRQNAVDESGLSVVVISHDFPWDPLCLKELVQIFECMDEKKKPAVLVFDGGVEPTSSFDRAFAYHEQQHRYTEEELKKWRSALTRAFVISGWKTHGTENAKLVQKICEHIQNPDRY